MDHPVGIVGGKYAEPWGRPRCTAQDVDRGDWINPRKTSNKGDENMWLPRRRKLCRCLVSLSILLSPPLSFSFSDKRTCAQAKGGGQTNDGADGRAGGSYCMKPLVSAHGHKATIKFCSLLSAWLSTLQSLSQLPSSKLIFAKQNCSVSNQNCQ